MYVKQISQRGFQSARKTNVRERVKAFERPGHEEETQKKLLKQEQIYLEQQKLSDIKQQKILERAQKILEREQKEVLKQKQQKLLNQIRQEIHDDEKE